MRSLRQLGVSSALRPIGVLQPWVRRQRPYSSNSSSSPGRGVQPVAVVGASDLDLEAFRERAFLAEKPLLVKGGREATANPSSDSHGKKNKARSLPATSRWFAGEPGSNSSMRLAPYFEQFSMTQLPYELMYPPRPGGGGHAMAGFLAWLAGDTAVMTTNESAVRPGLAELLSHCIASSSPSGGTVGQPRLIRLEAPLALFMAAVEYNGTLASSSTDAVTQLYIAQASLSELPTALQQDVHAPDLVQHGGRGDVYDSSLWLGLEPTYTPWHRDPNPNLFCQLCSDKTVRLMPPAGGEHIFRQVQMELMKQRAAACAGSGAGVGAGTTFSSSRIRGEEMMQGPERQLLHDAAWGDSGDNSGDDRARITNIDIMHEAHLEAGDMLFIPKGWWHSVKSAHADGRLNGSVNWWFR